MAALPYKRQTRLASAARRWPHPNQGDINKNSNVGQKRKACYRITKDWKTDKDNWLVLAHDSSLMTRDHMQ